MRHVIVLAGGGGTRLWPASRRDRPKQLLPLGSDAHESLLAATVRRLRPLAPLECLWVVTAADQVAGVRGELPVRAAEQIVVEPAARNTAAAIGLAVVRVLAVDREAVIGVVPADHHIVDEPAYRVALAVAFEVAERHDAIVTVGIRPSRPETGFGWLELGDMVSPGVRRVVRFVEKPDQARAESLLAGGGHLWNSGMFFFPGGRMLDAISRHLPDTAVALSAVSEALATGGAAAAEKAAAERYPSVPAISIDYGVMEKEAGILTVPADYGWNDVGSWTALADLRPADAAGNVSAGRMIAHQAARNVVHTDPDTLVALLGVEDLVVVRSGNAVLVAPRARAQEVRELVRLLEPDGADFL